MLFSLITNNNKNDNADLEKQLLLIHSGDAQEREKMIKTYTPFIIKATSKVINTYIDLNNCDEYSIALMAFNEAIDKYSFTKGPFLNYSELVIRNRIIDYKRKQNKIYLNSVSINNDNNAEDILTCNDDFTYSLEIKDQLEILKDKLYKYNITLDDLLSLSPKHKDTRLRAIQIAYYMHNTEEIRNNFYRLKRLPIKKLVANFNVSSRTLKRLKIFIITIFIILESDLDLIKNHLLQIERRLSNNA
ncbi:sigma factor [Clostridiaceae bacterium M8S5]|nr:sigma factor [Clostridiaceae bacterium M8S5]